MSNVLWQIRNSSKTFKGYVLAPDTESATKIAFHFKLVIAPKYAVCRLMHHLREAEFSELRNGPYGLFFRNQNLFIKDDWRNPQIKTSLGLLRNDYINFQNFKEHIKDYTCAPCPVDVSEQMRLFQSHYPYYLEYGGYLKLGGISIRLPKIETINIPR